MAYDAWYAHRCIDHASDIPECFGGEADAARKWCESHVYGSPLKTCVQDYLDDGRPDPGHYRCTSVDNEVECTRCGQSRP